MIKTILNKIFNRGSKVNELENTIKELQAQLNDVRKVNNQPTLHKQTLREEYNVDKSFGNAVDEMVVDRNKEITHTRTNIDYNSVDWKELDRNNPEVVLEMKADLRDEIFEAGIDNIIPVLENKRTELLQDYLISLKCINGSYQPEFDNIDSLSREQIIEQIDEISFENFKEAMARKGFKVNPPSEKQIAKLKELGFIGTMPKTSIGASKLIESVVGKADNKPTQAQINRISKLVELLGFQGEDYSYKTKFEASKVIEKLQKIADDTLGEEKASDKQIEYYSRLLKQNNQRFVGKKKAFAENATKKEISNAIEKLKKEIAKNHPELSEGQLSYLISLHQRLMLPFNKDELAKLTKEEASKIIAKLNKEVLYLETRRYQASLTMNDIKKMSDNEVRDMLKQIAQDKKDQNPA